VLVVVLIVLAALVSIAGITFLSARSELQSGGHSRSQQAALYAAESGVAAAMEYLRDQCTPSELYSALVDPQNDPGQQPGGITGNGVEPGQTGNPFTAEQQTWYQVTVLNNRTDPGFAAGNDTDAALVIRSVGYGPSGASTTVEVELVNGSCLTNFCELTYAQAFVNASNSAVAACSSVLGSSATTTYGLP
jgi:hypothetical protein